MCFFPVTASKPAQRVFRIKMLFPSDVLCNEAGQVSSKPHAVDKCRSTK